VLLKVSEEEERLQVVGLVAPVGAVTAQVSVTVPVNELPGVTVMVAVLPLVAPGLTVRLPLLVRVKPVLLVVLGACQKFPQPARNGVTASIDHAHLPILIAVPFVPLKAARAAQGCSCRSRLLVPLKAARAAQGCSCRSRLPAAQGSAVFIEHLLTGYRLGAHPVSLLDPVSLLRWRRAAGRQSAHRPFDRFSRKTRAGGNPLGRGVGLARAAESEVSAARIQPAG
jgi:hypothetical protein